MIIGITGGVGTGKSSFAGELARLGVRVIDADAVGKRLVDREPAIQDSIRKRFGTEMFDEKGKLKRRELGRRVFSDKNALEDLNRIIRPALVDHVLRQIEEWRISRSKSILAVDIAILFEANFQDHFEYIVVVTTSLERRIKWLAKERGWSKQEIMDRIESQMHVDEKVKRANLVIFNDKGIDKLREAAQNLYETIQSGRVCP